MLADLRYLQNIGLLNLAGLSLCRLIDKVRSRVRGLNSHQHPTEHFPQYGIEDAIVYEAAWVDVQEE